MTSNNGIVVGGDRSRGMLNVAKTKVDAGLDQSLAEVVTIRNRRRRQKAVACQVQRSRGTAPLELNREDAAERLLKRTACGSQRVRAA